METLKRYCRLCGDAIRGKSYRVLDDTLKQILDIVLLKLRFDDEVGSAVCECCSVKLLAAMNFKSVCLHSDNGIIPYVDIENPLPVDLKEKAKGQVNMILDDLGICRLCMKPISGECVSMQKVPVEKIQIYIPEIYFKVTVDPVCCNECYDSLTTHSDFIRSCLNFEEKMNEGRNMVNTVLAAAEYIKCEEIHIKSEEENYEEEEVIVTKLEAIEDESCPSSHPCETEVLRKSKLLESVQHEDKRIRIDKRQYEVQHKDCVKPSTPRNKNKCDNCAYVAKQKRYLKSHMLRHKDPSEVQLYKCDKCKYETKYKKGIKSHMLRHKDPSEVKMYKCEECKYESKYKIGLKNHILVHKDPPEVEMYKCDVCKYETRHKNYLKSHLLIHKSASEVKMYKCDECKFETKYKKGLIAHTLVHKKRLKVQMLKCDEYKYETKENA